ncbi:MAG: lycopene cyclase domain-containing protein [Halorhabdus sp.]
MTLISYFAFALVFVVLPLVVVGTVLFVTRRWHPAQLFGTGLLALVALVYTLPWDGYLIRLEVWQYGSSLIGRIGVVPYEEVLFITAQTLMTGFWTALVVSPDGAGPSISLRQRLAGVIVGVVVGVVGFGLLVVPSTLYLGAILAWAAPVLALQWGFGWPVLLRARREVLAALAIPTAYLWAVDRLAIALGLWTFSSAHTTGITVLGLPIEEALFFLATNVFLVQGLVLFGWVVQRGVLPSVTDALRTVPERVD